MKERGNWLLRSLDRYLGIPLVIFMAIFKRNKPWPEQIKRIAFLKTAGIGDMLLLSAVLEDVKKALPKIEITLFSGISNSEAAHLISHVKVVSLPVTNPFKALSMIRKESFDLIVDCDPWPRINAILSYFSKSKCSIGFKTARQFRHYLYDYTVSHSFSCHELENYQKLVRPLGVEPARKPFLPISAAKSLECKVALHLFAGGSRAYLKEWPLENWKEIIRFLLRKNIKVLLTGGKNDFQPLQEFVLGKNVHNLAGKYSLLETAHQLASCACLVSVDTGIMHLGSALNIPVVALFGPTSPKRWGGLSEKVISLTPDLKYTPCIQLGFESSCSHSFCMKAISTERVKHTLLKILEEKRDESGDFGRRAGNEALAAFQEEIP